MPSLKQRNKLQLDNRGWNGSRNSSGGVIGSG